MGTNRELPLPSSMLAAGKGTRMKSRLAEGSPPDLAGRPMLGFPLMAVADVPRARAG